MNVLDLRDKSENKSEENLSNNYNQETSTFKKVKDYLWEVIKIVTVSLIIIIPIRMYVVQPFIVEGDSMLPNFHDGEYLIVDEISYRFADPKRGDVIIFHPPQNPKNYYIKRIIGMPGEKVVLKDQQIVIYNTDHEEGAVLDESLYLTNSDIVEEIEIELEEDQYYVIGDNRNNSLDSRRFGPINFSNIKGRALIRAFPFNNLTIFKTPEYII